MAKKKKTSKRRSRPPAGPKHIRDLTAAESADVERWLLRSENIRLKAQQELREADQALGRVTAPIEAEVERGRVRMIPAENGAAPRYVLEQMPPSEES